MGLWGDFGGREIDICGKIHPPENCVFSDIFGSDVMCRAVAFCMDIAICHKRKFGGPSSFIISHSKTPLLEGTPLDL